MTELAMRLEARRREYLPLVELTPEACRRLGDGELESERLRLRSMAERMAAKAPNVLKLLVNLKEYLQNLVFDDIGLQVINEIWIESIEVEIKKARGLNDGKEYVSYAMES